MTTKIIRGKKPRLNAYDVVAQQVRDEFRGREDAAADLARERVEQYGQVGFFASQHTSNGQSVGLKNRK